MLREQIATNQIAPEKLTQQKELLDQATYNYFRATDKPGEDSHEVSEHHRDLFSSWILKREAKTNELRELFRLDEAPDHEDPWEKHDDLEWLFTEIDE